MSGITDFWEAEALVTKMREEHGRRFEILYSNGEFTVQPAPLTGAEMDPSFRKWLSEFGVTP